MYLYHATRRSNADAIRSEGLTGSITEGYSPRYVLNQAADRLGQQSHARWERRTAAVYCWETLTQAREYTQSGLDFDTVVKVDPVRIAGDVWKMPYEQWETLYQAAAEQRPRNVSEGDQLWASLESLISSATLDDGSRPGEYEAWTSHVPPDAIVSVDDFAPTDSYPL